MQELPTFELIELSTSSLYELKEMREKSFPISVTFPPQKTQTLKVIQFELKRREGV